MFQIMQLHLKPGDIVSRILSNRVSVNRNTNILIKQNIRFTYYHFEHNNIGCGNIIVTIIVLTLWWHYHLRDFFVRPPKHLFAWAKGPCITMAIIHENRLCKLFFKENKTKAVIEKGLLASMECHMGQNLINTEVHKSVMEMHNWPYLCISIIKLWISIIVYKSFKLTPCKLRVICRNRFL